MVWLCPDTAISFDRVVHELAARPDAVQSHEVPTLYPGKLQSLQWGSDAFLGSGPKLKDARDARDSEGSPVSHRTSV